MNCRLFAQQWHTTLDIRRPAANTIPAGVEDLLVVNNAVAQPDDFGHSQLIDDQSLGAQSVDLSQAPARLLFAVTEALDYSYLFWSVGLVAESQNDGSFFTTQTLSNAQVEALCEHYNADAVLALNKIILYDKQESFLTEDDNYYAYLEVYVSTQWTLFYHKNGSLQISPINHTDTLLWEGSDYDRAQAIAALPDRQTALLDVAAYEGETFADLFIPHWETVDRYLYENDNSMVSEGLVQFTYRHWEQAIEIWQEAYEELGSSRETKAYAAADIAVASEILGDLSAAKQWAKRSVDAFAKMRTSDAAQQQVNMTYYLRQLEQREKDEKKLSSGADH